MKNKSPKPVAKTPVKQTNVPGQGFIPPAYGINFVDKQSISNDAPVQGVFESSSEETFAESNNNNSTATSSNFLPNKTGLPDNIKTGIENLSGFSMDTVRVHYNSSLPAQLNAFAYTQGTEIHVAPGQERHLPHEAWHTVQQMQGRVQPTMQMKGNGVSINDDALLEKEADVMGAKVLQMPGNNQVAMSSTLLQDRKEDTLAPALQRAVSVSSDAIIQRTVQDDIDSAWVDISAAEDYAGDVSNNLDPYVWAMQEMDESGDADLKNYAVSMGKGFAAWAANFLNKSGAYLYEAEIASNETDTRSNPNIYAILGVDTDEQPDLEIVSNKTIMSNDPFPVPRYQDIQQTAVEVKASTSPKYASVDKLIAGGMKQLKKRQDTNRYKFLRLEIDNAKSCWPITENRFANVYGSDYDSIDRQTWDDRLDTRISEMRDTYGITLPLEVNAYVNGHKYANAQTQSD